MLQLGCVPTLGSLVGNAGNSDLLKQINGELHGSNFFNSVDDILSKGREMFVHNFVEPIRKIGNTVKNALGAFDYDDKIIMIDTKDKLHEIPTCMHIPILQYAPIRKLFDEGRIFGFGYNAIPTGDPYGRLINNGTVSDVAAEMDKKTGEIEFDMTWKSTDPDLSFSELDSIEASRKFIDEILENTRFDPTDYDNERG